MKKGKLIAWVKKFETDGGTTIAACDINLLGQTLALKNKKKEANKEIIVNESFYGGRKVTRGELAFLLKRGETLNLIGKRVIKTAEKVGIAHKEAKIFLWKKENEEKVPHVQTCKVQI